VKFTLLENALWIAGFIGNLCLLAILLGKSRAKNFPIFTTFVIYQILETVALFSIHRAGTPHAYFLAYWGSAFGGYVFQLALIYEIARDVLRPTGIWIRKAQNSFLIWSGVGLLAATVFSLSLKFPGKSLTDFWLIRSSILTSLLTCEVFLAMSVSANRLGMQWKSHIMALGEGLTIWAVAALLGDLGHFITGWHPDARGFIDAQSFAYVGTVVFWAISFAQPERKREPLSVEMEARLHALHERIQIDHRILTSSHRPTPK
jgi:hypothetical protein